MADFMGTWKKITKGDRYNITSEKDLADAARKIELSYRQAKNEAEQSSEQNAEVEQHDTIQ